MNTWYEKHRTLILKSLNKKYRTDAAFRSAAQAQARRRYHEDEKYRIATIARAQARYRKLRNKINEYRRKQYERTR